MTTPFYFKPPSYNALGRQQLWIDGCINSHDIWCGCDRPLVHFISAILPVGHKDRDLTIQELINRDLPCHSGGIAAAAGGQTTDSESQLEGTGTNIEDLEKIFSEDTIDELIAAAAADTVAR